MGKKKPQDLSKSAKDIKGRIKVLRVTPYQGINIYIRQIDDTIFEYILPFGAEIYSSWMEIAPETGKTKLSNKQLKSVVQIVLAGAHSTIEYLMGIESKEKELGKVALEAGEKVWGEEEKK